MCDLTFFVSYSANLREKKKHANLRNRQQVKMENSTNEKSSAPTSNGTIQIPVPTVLEPISDKTSAGSFITSKSMLAPSPCTSPRVPAAPCTPVSPTVIKTSLQPPDKDFVSPGTISASKPNATENTGSATGNPRNKCALQPGHSLMDWIRLGNSGKDLTGVGGRMRPVTLAELSAHNTPKDAWLAIRGRVYNITYYLPFHPGGADELMRGAGMDATQLFDKVHPWVNYDSLLAKCLIGPLRHDLPDAEEIFGTNNHSPKSDRLREPSKAQDIVRKSMENLANCITPVKKKISKNEDSNKSSSPSKIMQSLIKSSDLPVSISRQTFSNSLKMEEKSEMKPSPLRYDWIQTSMKLTVSVYTGCMANPGACARIHDGALTVEVASDGWLRTIKIVPENKLKEDVQLKAYAESGKLEVTVQKAEAGVWKGIGEVVLGIPTRVSTPRSLRCRVVSVSEVTHDTRLVGVQPECGPVLVPLGHHVCVHRNITGSECARSYTPVGEGWGPSDCIGALKLAIKRYESGALSPILTSLSTGDMVTLSGPYGKFQLHKLKSVRKLYFIAAGTGITPMLGLLRFMLARSNPRCENVHLLFFNKTEQDILFRDNFEELRREDDRLRITHVLSDAVPSWAGHKGRITAELLTEVLGTIECGECCVHFACVCGPTEFTHATMGILDKLRVRDDCVHAFMG